MRTTEVARHLGVTYRQLDYVARSTAPGSDLAGARGSGTRRLWDPGLVARLEVATLLSKVSGLPWYRMARAVLAASGPPPAGFAFLDDLGDVHFTENEHQLAELIARGNGGIVTRYPIPDAA